MLTLCVFINQPYGFLLDYGLLLFQVWFCLLLLGIDRLKAIKFFS